MISLDIISYLSVNSIIHILLLHKRYLHEVHMVCSLLVQHQYLKKKYILWIPYLLFVGYQFLLVLWDQVNDEFKCSTNGKCIQGRPVCGLWSLLMTIW